MAVLLLIPDRKLVLFQIRLCQNSSAPIARFVRKQSWNRIKKKGKLFFSFQKCSKKECTKVTLFVPI
jgi:hypothetical protein